MYHPKTTGELFEILWDLQHYAELQGLPRLSEALADAGIVFAMDRRQLEAAELCEAEAKPKEI
ncbi:MAG: hypothetical protein AAFY59_18300 [Pseudomonadota bacterium]